MNNNDGSVRYSAGRAMDDLSKANESFQGAQVRPEAEERYRAMRGYAEQLKSATSFVDGVKADLPVNTERNAHVYVDLPGYAMLNTAAKAAFAGLVQTADSVYAADREGGGTRFTFAILDYWVE